MAEHWSDPYVGRPYTENFDCAELARLVNREVFGREIRLPSERWYRGLSGHAKLEAMTAQIDSVKDDYGMRTEKPAEGDGVLIVSRGHNSHIGVYCVIAGEAWVLHAASHAKQVILTRLRELERFGYKLEGCYKWT